MAVAKDLTIGKEYWLDDTQEVSGVCVEVNIKKDMVRFNPTPGQIERYSTDDKGLIPFPVDVPYEYKEVEA